MSELPAKKTDPGVPEAVPRVLIRVRDRLGTESIDRIWIFPPSRTGRREQGLFAITTYEDGEDRLRLITAAYNAEHTGKGITIEPTFTREGWAPPETFPPVMAGVVRRSGDGSGEPREVRIEGSPERFEELMEEFDDVFVGGGPLSGGRP